jgi:hypothetical protein
MSEACSSEASGHWENLLSTFASRFAKEEIPGSRGMPNEGSQSYAPADCGVCLEKSRLKPLGTNAPIESAGIVRVAVTRPELLTSVYGPRCLCLSRDSAITSAKADPGHNRKCKVVTNSQLLSPRSCFLRVAILIIAVTLRSTSSSVVAQLDTLIRIAVCPCHCVPPHQQVPSFWISVMTSVCPPRCRTRLAPDLGPRCSR